MQGIDQPREVAAQHERGVSRHQAIFSLDYGTWHKIIAARKIKESLIPHRLDDNPTQVGGRGWYG
jgi:non-structural maintenance of chromosomes element 4